MLNFASPLIKEVRIHNRPALMTYAMIRPTGTKSRPIAANFAGSAAPAGAAGREAAMACIAAWVNGRLRNPMIICRAPMTRNGARNFGFSRTRSKTAVGSSRTLNRSSTAPIRSP